MKQSIFDRLGGDSTSLWPPLHDAEVVSVASDLVARRVTIAAQVDHLSLHLSLAKETLWTLIVEGASAANACGFEFHPTPPPKTAGLTRDEEVAVVREWQSKGRMASLAWSEFERRVSVERIRLSDALVRRCEDGVWLCGQGNLLDSDQFVDFAVGGTLVRCERSGDVEVPIEDLLSAGQKSWQAFGERKRTSGAAG